MYSLNCKRATMTVKYFGNRIGLYTNLHIDMDLWNSKGQKETGDNLYMRMSEAQINFIFGYYDCLLPLLHHAYKLGICFDFQKVEQVPTDANDICMDKVL